MTTQTDVVDINGNTNDNIDDFRGEAPLERGTAHFVPPVEEVKPEEVKPKAKPRAKAKAKAKEEIHEEIKEISHKQNQEQKQRQRLVKK